MFDDNFDYDFYNLAPIKDYRLTEDDKVKVVYKVGYNFPIMEYPKEELINIEQTFRRQMQEEAKNLNKTNFVLLLNSITYVTASIMAISLLMPLFGENASLLFATSYTASALFQVGCFVLGENFPVFGPKKLKQRKEMLEKLKLFLENEDGIKQYLKEHEESNNCITSFSGDIRDVRSASYEEILTVTKQLKKRST